MVFLIDLLTYPYERFSEKKVLKIHIHNFEEISLYPHCKFLPHENYGDWELQSPCRENLHYLRKRAVRIAGKPWINYRSCNYHRVSPQFLQPFSIDSADFPCRDPAISSPCSFYGQNICSVLKSSISTYSKPCTSCLECFVLEHSAFKTKHLRRLLQILGVSIWNPVKKVLKYGTVWVIRPIILVEALLRAVSYPLRSITMSNHVATYVNHSSPMGDGKCFDSQLVFELVPPLLQSVQQKLE